MTAVGILAQALKATALVVLLSLGCAMPAQAHPGHSKPPAIAPAANGVSQDPRLTIDAASPESEPINVCETSTARAPDQAGDGPKHGAAGSSCCGTMCTVAVIEHDVPALPLRVSRRLRLGLPPERISPVRAPGLHARPPRTIDIA